MHADAALLPMAKWQHSTKAQYIGHSLLYHFIHVILDELHVLLRIFDVMLRNLIMIMKSMDDRLHLHTNLHLHQLVALKVAVFRSMFGN